MSNEFILAQQEITGGTLLFLLVAAVAALTVAYYLGIFSRRSMQSPDRIGADERPGMLGLIFLAGLVTWILAPAFYLASRGNAAATQGEAVIAPRDQVMMSTIGALVALGVLVIGNQHFREHGLRRLGLGVRGLREGFWQGLVGILLVLPLLTWVTLFTMGIWQAIELEHPEKHELLDVLDKTPDPVLATMLVFTAVVIAPVYEELLFRGHLQTLLRHFLRRPWVAVLLTSAAFAVVHPVWTQPPIFFLAVCLGYAYERTGNLWVPVIMHSLFNGTSVVLSYYVQS